MLVGYARVSTLDQNLDAQRDALKAAGWERIFEEKRAGKAGSKRPEYEAALAYLRPQDVLVVWKFDRLGRSLVEMMRTISLMVKKGEVIGHLHVKEGESVDIKATIDGVLRGAIYDGSKVAAGQKIADIHPTMGQEECYTISDKARCIGGSVLEAVMAWESKKPKHRFFGH